MVGSSAELEFAYATTSAPDPESHDCSRNGTQQRKTTCTGAFTFVSAQDVEKQRILIESQQFLIDGSSLEEAAPSFQSEV